MCKVILNNELNGIELYFDSKPEEDLRNKMKENKFRWNHFKKCWYSKQNKNSLKFTESLNCKIINDTNITSSKTKSSKQVITELKGIKLNDIFVYSWGYEQTNIDYFQVIGFKGKSTVLVKKIHGNIKSREGISSMAGYSTPELNNFINDEVIEKRLIERPWSNKPYIKMDYSIAQLWDGKENYVSWYA